SEDLRILPAPATKVEQAEAGEVAHGDGEPSGPIVRAERLEGVAVLEAEDVAELLLQDASAVLLVDASGEGVVVEGQRGDVVGVGCAGRFGEAVAGRLRGEVPPGDARVLASVERAQPRLEFTHLRVDIRELAVLHRPQQEGADDRLDGGGDVAALCRVAPG